jgi:hypothetical protein
LIGPATGRALGFSAPMGVRTPSSLLRRDPSPWRDLLRLA